ncbi:MAG: hypothetical protein H6564_15500 [Lewinellaceae bacterium]|nr:hypothetical protein [Lewinellaceae bacterium]
MAKKRFTEGLESVFGAASEDTLQEDSPLLSTTRPKESPDEKGEGHARHSHAKDFSSDLEAFLSGAFEDSFEEQYEQREAKRQPISANPQVKKRHRRPMSGLDALIRSTIEPENVRVQERNARRVTLTFDPDKLDKLKKIARLEKAYLRDIIDEIVSDYLDDYEQSHKKK